MSTTSIHHNTLQAAQHSKLEEELMRVKIENEKYLRQHPEVHQVISEVTRQVLLRRPDEPVAFAEDMLATSDLQAIVRQFVQLE